MLVPQQNYLHLKKHRSEVEVSGEDATQKGEVIAQGPGHYTPEGVLVPLSLDLIGKTVVYQKYADTHTTFVDGEGTEHVFVKSNEIIAVEE